ncbi:hypothetical protein [Candidatus Methylomirabilis sp.]|uniref:hypothetical protein n=1 Tax=Candidatus Methylomirabilis sp. TaxID=2032687 RepID=UPI003076695E
MQQIGGGHHFQRKAITTRNRSDNKSSTEQPCDRISSDQASEEPIAQLALASQVGYPIHAGNQQGVTDYVTVVTATRLLTTPTAGRFESVA